MGVSIGGVEQYANMPKEVIKATSGALLPTEVKEWRLVSNYGQTDDVVLTLPAAAENCGFTLFIATTVAKYYKITADTNDAIILNGTKGSDNGSIQIASATQGSSITFRTVKTGVGVYDWAASTVEDVLTPSISGSWVVV